MQYEQALVVCAFGWGKEFRLYKETLYVGNKAYRLARLTQVRLKTQQALGVPSACLELCFGRERVVLRGIAAVEDARKVAEYLVSWCGEGQKDEPHRSPKSSTVPLKQPQTPAPLLPTTMFHQQVTRPVDAPLMLPGDEDTQTTSRFGRKRDRKTEHLAQADAAPVISVPVRLEIGEQAYFSSRATRCTELIRETLRSTYPAQDHGLLILTDRRLLFIGRRSQLILEYPRLQRLTRLEGALAFETDHWQQRAIFTMPRPDLCAARLEAILQLRATMRLPEVAPSSPRTIIPASRQAVVERVEHVSIQ
jgi:hypothetical protein